MESRGQRTYLVLVHASFLDTDGAILHETTAMFTHEANKAKDGPRL